MVFVNTALEIIINNIKIRIHEIYDTESIIHEFFDGITFVRIFDELEEQLKSIVNNRVIYSNFRETDVDRLFLDLRTLYLPMLEKAVHEVVQYIHIIVTFVFQIYAVFSPPTLTSSSFSFLTT